MFKMISYGILKIVLIAFAFKAHAASISESAYRASLSADFVWRDRLPETNLAYSPSKDTLRWAWGPKPAIYPTVVVPTGVNSVRWKRDRVIAVAKKYIGLPYKHRHIPSQGGLDCSNFTSWVYNYGFGIHFSSNVQRQSQSAGRQLEEFEKFEPGDLLFIWNKTKTKITHVVIYVDSHTIIDSTITKDANGVALRPFQGRYKQRLALARRIFF